MSEGEFIKTFSQCFNSTSKNAPEFATFAVRSAYAEGPFTSFEALFRALASPLLFGDRTDVVNLMRNCEPLGNKRPDSHAGLPEWEGKSNTEHASVGLNRLSAEDFALCADLNRQYREKHGFTFIIRVSNRTTAEIIAALARRLHNTTEEEVAIGLRQYTEIIQLRLKNIVAADA